MTQALTPDAEEVLSGEDPTQMGAAENALRRLGELALERLSEAFEDAWKAGAVILCIAFLCGCVRLFAEDRVKPYVTVAGTAALVASASATLLPFLNKGMETVEELSALTASALPVMAAASAAAGAPVSAAAKYAAAALFLSLVQQISKSLLEPLIYAFLAVSAAACAVSNRMLEHTAALIKRIAVSIMTASVLSFVIYLSVTGIVSGTADAAATRVLKTAVSTALPVVGGIVSDAAASVAAGLGVLRGSVGVFGLLAVCAVCVGPLAGLGVRWAVFRVTQALSDCFGESGISPLIGALGDAFGMTLGLAGAYAVMLFVTLYSMMRTVIGG